MVASNSGHGASSGVVAVFGGTGFVGRRIVKHLLAKGFNVRSVSRHPQQNAASLTHEGRSAERVEADILDPPSIANAVAGASAVVNAVSLYVERGDLTFDRVHVQAASDLARTSHGAEVSGFIQISGIGSDPRSSSAYIGARGRGEQAVRAAFPSATIVRPAVMVGPDDTFLTTIVRLARILPVYPLFGHGETLLQPVYVEDVAEGIARIVSRQVDHSAPTVEFAGPRVYAYRDLVLEIAGLFGKRVTLMPVPFPVWSGLAAVAEWLPGAPIARNQVELMQDNNVPSGDLPGLADLEIVPREIDEIVRMIRDKR
jgi:NADH dehydrogenase